MVKLVLRDKHYAVFQKLSNGPCTFEEILSFVKKKVRIVNDELYILMNDLILHGYVVAKNKKCNFDELFNPAVEKFLLYYITRKALWRLEEHKKCYHNRDAVTKLLTSKKYSRKVCIQEIEKILKKDNPKMKRKLYMYPFWHINVERQEIRENYADLTIQCDIIGTDNRHVRYLKILFDDGRSTIKFLARKMLRMTGTCIVLSLATWRTKNLMKGLSQVTDEEIKTDGILFGILSEFFAGGLLGTSFKTPEGTTLQFQPNCSEDSL